MCDLMHASLAVSSGSPDNKLCDEALSGKATIGPSPLLSNYTLGRHRRILTLGTANRRTYLDMRIRLAIRIIEEQPGDLGSALKTTAELLGLSQTRFRHLFKQEIGKAWSQYLREVKMAGAAQSITRHAVPIKKIAQQCGYEDLSNFYRDFRRVHGMTPQQLRAHHLDLLCQSKGLPDKAM